MFEIPVVLIIFKRLKVLEIIRQSKKYDRKIMQLYYALQGVNGYEIPAEGVCSVAPITK